MSWLLTVFPRRLGAAGFSKFSAIVVVGDGKGTVGFGMGKSGEVPDAIRKGIEDAKKIS